MHGQQNIKTLILFYRVLKTYDIAAHRLVGLLHFMYWNLTHHDKGTGLLPVFRIPPSKTTLST